VTLPRGIIILGIVSILSVALNLFLAGNILGHRFRGPMPPPMVLEERFEATLRELPEEDRATVKQILDSRRELIMSKWHALRSDNRKVAEAIESDPFTAEQAKAAFDKSNADFTEFRAAIQETAIEIASKISPEGRKQLHLPGGGF
jgi:uncharacterized membrane protein